MAKIRTKYRLHSGKELMAEQGFEGLSKAIMQQSIVDYVNGAKHGDDILCNEVKWFFQSKWAAFLSHTEIGELAYILDLLDEEMMKKCY